MALHTFGFFEFQVNSREKQVLENEADSIPSILDTDLTTLTYGQRIALTAIVSILCILSVSGNLGTLYAIRKRKVRLFFRSCLISLALSDLLTTVFMTMGYLAQFGAPYVQVWFLGELLCKFIPFVTTGAILVSSMTLVGIALDRYFAVMRIVLGFFNPNKWFCILYSICIWGLSLGIASPMYSAYTICQVYIVMAAVDRNGRTELVEVDLVKMCVSDKESNAYYYVIVLAIIFVPSLIAFVWLNSVIANKLWIRRHSLSTLAASRGQPTTTPLSAPANVAGATVSSGNAKEKQMEMAHNCQCQGNNNICYTSPSQTVPTSLATIPTVTVTTTVSPTKNNLNTNTTTTGAGTNGKGNSAKHIRSREARHLRMFTIVLILMAVFILFRLPAWIFLILRMYGTYTHPVHWILHFSFGILTLTSCVLNPLLYTFLAETIQYAMFMKDKLWGLRRYFKICGMNGCYCLMKCCNGTIDDKDTEKMTQNRSANQNNDDHSYDESGSYDGIKGTSRKSVNDSEVYTIPPGLKV